MKRLLTGLVDHETLQNDEAGQAAIRRDARARELIQGFVMVVTAPDADGDRRTLARFLAGQLGREHPAAIKGFFLRQLHLD